MSTVCEICNGIQGETHTYRQAPHTQNTHTTNEAVKQLNCVYQHGRYYKTWMESSLVIIGFKFLAKKELSLRFCSQCIHES